MIRWFANYHDFDALIPYLEDLINCSDDNGETPLHFCCNNAFDPDCELLAVLLKHPRTQINLKCNRGFSPLHRAAFDNKYVAVKRLLQCPEIIVNAYDNDGDTALHVTLAESLERSLGEICRAKKTIRAFLEHDECLIFLKNCDGKSIYNICYELRNSFQSQPRTQENNRKQRRLTALLLELNCFEAKARYKMFLLFKQSAGNRTWWWKE
jgi:ankyrin repeat protein